LIQSGKNGVLEVWDVAGGKRLKQLTQSPAAHVLATSPDGRWLATLEHHTGAIDKLLEKDVIHLWDLRDGKKVREFTQKGWFMRIFFTPDSNRLLACNCVMGDRYFSLGWDLSTGKEVDNPVPYLLFASAFHPEGGNRFVHGGLGKFDQWDLGVASLLVTASSALINANPSGDLIVPFELVKPWCLPITFGALMVLALFVAFLLIRTRVGLIYEVAKMNALLGLPVGRVQRIAPFSIFFIMQALISLAGGACGGLFSIYMMYLANPEPAHVAVWAALIGLAITAALMALYVVTVNHTTSDRRLQNVGK
jgi:hypothetical protein